MAMKLEKSWYQKLSEEIDKPYIGILKDFMEKEKDDRQSIFPPEPLIFNAFLQTPFDAVKVVIIGQDPYHGPGQAHGLSFSVPEGVALPPSLKNIFLELQQDVGVSIPKHGCLLSWAKQGVLLLNATLTVRAGQPRSHYGKGWERFTDAVVEKLLEKKDPIVFMLWGKAAQEKLQQIQNGQNMAHAVLTAAHPSPYSAHAGFFGCRHFSKANALLEKWGKTAIDWRLAPAHTSLCQDLRADQGNKDGSKIDKDLCGEAPDV